MLLMLTVGAASSAADDVEVDPGLVRIPVNPYPPWIIETETGFEGIDIAILDALMKAVGRPYRLIPCPWLRCLKLMEQGKADLMSGLFRSPDRERYLQYIEPPYYRDPPKTFYTARRRALQLRRYEDLVPLKIGVIAGTLYFPRFDEDAQLNKWAFSEERQLVDLVLAHRLDAFISTELQADFLLEQAGVTAEFAKHHLEDIPQGYSYLAVSRATAQADLHATLSRVAERLQREGEFQRLIDAELKKRAMLIKKPPVALKLPAPSSLEPLTESRVSHHTTGQPGSPESSGERPTEAGLPVSASPAPLSLRRADGRRDP